jgi:hypothetical protein
MLSVALHAIYQSSAAPKIPATIPMNENEFAAALSPALEWLPVDEAALVEDG